MYFGGASASFVYGPILDEEASDPKGEYDPTLTHEKRVL